MNASDFIPSAEGADGFGEARGWLGVDGAYAVIFSSGSQVHLTSYRAA
jgi:hypothetical protein